MPGSAGYSSSDVAVAGEKQRQVCGYAEKSFQKGLMPEPFAACSVDLPCCLGRVCRWIYTAGGSGGFCVRLQKNSPCMVGCICAMIAVLAYFHKALAFVSLRYLQK